MNLQTIQSSLNELGLPAWLLYDFHGCNPIARHVAGLGEDRFSTRRWFGLVPARGEPIWLHHAIEAHLFADLPGRRVPFVAYKELNEKLRAMLKGTDRVAMEYAANGVIPYVSRVDAGTIEMVRAAGPQVVSSADLIQFCEARWSAEGLASHRRAAAALRDVQQATFKEVADAVKAGQEPTEYAIQQSMMRRYKELGMHADPPIVAVNAHAGNPHYEPRAHDSAPIRKGDLLLLDLWCREQAEGSIWADITWMAYLGANPPDKYREVWEIVAGARDAAVAFLKESASRGKRLRGADVDEVSRQHIVTRGYGDRFLHRTGHSIGFEVHGNGCNIDSLETIDERQLIPRTGFSIEPGIYLADFGIRSEIDCYMDERSVEVTTVVQDQIVPLLP
ncbi:MAG TPA: M24 family metallopeptidase [Candidatus Polarisedimenticolia bacterium]|nr:M24 family metallopeptidase [Candidatus Polarisedimenticolia bacterium]